MYKNQIFLNLDENIKKLDNVEKEIAMLELAIYQKNIERLTEQKLKEMRDFFEQQSKNYNQKITNYQKEIDKNIEKYKEQINKLINTYDNLYINTFKIMQDSINNQKIAIANIVTLSERLNDKEIPKEESKKIYNNMIACAQKKLNYSVIVDECQERIKWCIKNVQKDIDEIFCDDINNLQIYKENIIIKIRRIIFNKISGKSKYKKLLKNYEREYLKNIKNKNNQRIMEIVYTLKGIIKQMQNVKKQIVTNYNNMIKC